MIGLKLFEAGFEGLCISLHVPEEGGLISGASPVIGANFSGEMGYFVTGSSLALRSIISSFTPNGT